jgi:hypothetical protein
MRIVLEQMMRALLKAKPKARNSFLDLGSYLIQQFMSLLVLL